MCKLRNEAVLNHFSIVSSMCLLIQSFASVTSSGEKGDSKTYHTVISLVGQTSDTKTINLLPVVRKESVVESTINLSFHKME